MAAAAATGAGDMAKVKIAFGNTIVSTYPDGRQAQLWLHPDGSYTAEGRRLDRSSVAPIDRCSAAPTPAA